MVLNNKFFSLLSEHEQWRMNECLNLIPSENITSPAVRELLASDLGHRYTLMVNSTIHGVEIKNAYGGTKYTDQIETEAEEVAKRVFNAKYCTLKPLSGHVSGLIMLIAMCKPNDLIMMIDEKHGGYDGYMPRYMPKILNLQVKSLPFNEHDWNLDHDKAVAAIKENKPKLVLLGASFILFPYIIKPIREVCDETGSILGYDASHVLGLIAGAKFQKPLDDGVDIVIGSTHKTLFGPQGGLILTNHEDIFEKVSNKLSWYTIDNAHQHRIAGLGQALLEMDEFGNEYARQVVKNSKVLGHALSDSGFPIKAKHLDFTQSHQTLLDVNLIKSELELSSVELMNLLENENVIIDAVGRLGTSEMTRRGCKEDDMVKIAEFMERITIRKEKNVKNEIKKFLNKFDLEYCFK